MKKSFIVAILLALGLAPSLVTVYAEDSIGVSANLKTNVSLHTGSNWSGTSSTSTGDRGDQGENDNRGNGIGGEIRGDLKELGIRAGLVRGRIHAAVEVFTATINRLQKIITRIDARIAKIQAAGGNTTEAQGDVTLAQGNLSDAQAQVNILASFNIGTTTATTTIAADVAAAKAAAEKGRQDLQSARENLLKAVESLIQVEVGLKASTTAHYQDND